MRSRRPVGRPLVSSALMAGALAATVLTDAKAQETAPVVVRVPASPRAFGMGNAYTAGSGSDVVFYNPAGLGRPNGLFATVSRYTGASTQGALSSSTAIGRLNLAVFAHWLEYGSNQFPARPGGLTSRGAGYGQSLAAGIALASVVKGIRIGAAAKYLDERTPAARSPVAAFDFGLARDVGRLTIGIALQHLGADLELGGASVELPTRVSLGATSRRWPIATYFDLRASAAVARERDGQIAPGGGIELTYEPLGGWTVAARLGARRVDRSGTPALQPWTFGGSFGLDRFSLDYGFEQYRGAGSVHRVGLRIE